MSCKFFIPLGLNPCRSKKDFQLCHQNHILHLFELQVSILDVSDYNGRLESEIESRNARRGNYRAKDLFTLIESRSERKQLQKHQKLSKYLAKVLISWHWTVDTWPDTREASVCSELQVVLTLLAPDPEVPVPAHADERIDVDVDAGASVAARITCA